MVPFDSSIPEAKHTHTHLLYLSIHPSMYFIVLNFVVNKMWDITIQLKKKKKKKFSPECWYSNAVICEQIILGLLKCLSLRQKRWGKVGKRVKETEKREFSSNSPRIIFPQLFYKNGSPENTNVVINYSPTCHSKSNNLQEKKKWTHKGLEQHGGE